MPAITLRSERIALSCDYLPVWTHALAASGLQPVRSLQLTPPAPARGRIHVTIPELDYSLSIALATLHERQGRPWRPRLATPTAMDELESVVNPLNAHMSVALDDEPIGRIPITILPGWQWPLLGETRIAVAAFVLADDEITSRTLAAAWASGGNAAGGGSIGDGSAAPDAEPASILAALYRHLQTAHRIEYESPRVVHEAWSSCRVQIVRPPYELLPVPGCGRERGTCLDLSLLLAGCLENAGAAPLVLFTGEPAGAPDHAMPGCWREPAQRFRPLLTAGEAIRRHVAGGELLVVEATGICHGSRRLDFARAVAAARARIDSDARVHAVDIRAARPPIGAVRPVVLPYTPGARRAVRLGERLADELGARSRETLHLLYGLCVANGPRTAATLAACGTGGEPIAAVIRRALPREEHGGAPGKTTNWEICLAAARANARSAGRAQVDEIDLLWAIVDNPSRNIDKILGGVGCGRAALAHALEPGGKRPGLSASRVVQASDDGPSS